MSISRERVRSPTRLNKEEMSDMITAAVQTAMAPFSARLTSLEHDLGIVKQQLATLPDSMPSEVGQTSKRVSALERDTQSIKYNLRLLKTSERTQNIAIFPKPEFRDHFPNVALQHLARPLGLASSADLTLLVSRPGIKVVRCSSMAVKGQVMRFANRNTAGDVFKIILQDDMDKDEQAERRTLKPVMAHLAAAGLKPTWKRSAIVWIGRDGANCSMEPWQAKYVPSALDPVPDQAPADAAAAVAADLIALAEELSGDTPIADAPLTSIGGRTAGAAPIGPRGSAASSPAAATAAATVAAPLSVAAPRSSPAPLAAPGGPLPGPPRGHGGRAQAGDNRRSDRLNPGTGTTGTHERDSRSPPPPRRSYSGVTRGTAPSTSGVADAADPFEQFAPGVRAGN